MSSVALEAGSAWDARAAAPRRPARGLGHAVFLSAAILVAVALIAPVASLAVSALQGSAGLWPHLVAYVLPQALRDTVLLLLGVGLLVLVVGVGTAWLVAAHDFPGRRLVEWMLVLPLAVPTYIVAYAYLDLLHPVGPVQTGLRHLFGIASPRDLPFPEVRSLPVCALLIGFVLYPYVYLPVRAVFLLQGAEVLEAARTLGAGSARTFWRVALPLARPGIAVGASLALLEALNDIGASEFLGVRTLTVSIYATWVNRSDLPGAAQIALLLLVVVLALLAAEAWGRRQGRYVAGRRTPQRRPLSGSRAGLALLACAAPITVGFVAPAGYLLVEASKRVAFAGVSAGLARETLNTVLLSAGATVLTVGLGLVLASGARLYARRVPSLWLRAAGFGYALPGTILAVALLGPLAGFDRMLAAVTRDLFGVTLGLLAGGTAVALIYAYTVRFLAISIGAAEAGLAKLPASQDEASRVLGQGTLGTFRLIHVPFAWTAVASGALLVFVDCMKELPATLLLRPLNVETLATHLYGEAARGTYEDGAVAALIIVLIGLLPLTLLSRLGPR